MAKSLICRQWLYLKLLFGCLISSLMLSPAGWAKNGSAPPKYDLRQLENILLGKNSNLEALYHQLKQALHQQAGDYLNFGPSLRLNYNYYPQKPGSAYEITDENPVSAYEQWGEVSLVYPLIDAIWDRHYSKKEKQLLVEEKQALLEAGQLELLLELRRQYAAAYKEKLLVNEYKKRNGQLSLWLAATKQRYYYKQALLPEVLDLEALQLNNQQLLDQHRRNYSLKLIQLGQLAGLERKDWEAVFPLAAPPPIPDKQSMLNLLDRHPLIRVHRIRASRDNVQLASRRSKPLKLEALFGYIVEEDRTDGYQSGSRLGFRFSIPLAYNKLVDYQKLSLLDDQKRWEAEASAQRQNLKQQLAIAYNQLEGINAQQKLILKQIQRTEKKINFLKNQLEYPLAEPEHPWQRLIAAYQQQWQTQEKQVELDYREQLAYFELRYLAGNHSSLEATTLAQPASFAGDVSRLSVNPRGLYVEDTDSLADPAQRKFLIQFCYAKGINRLLLNMRRLFASSETPPWLPELIADLHKQHITVWAMSRPYNPLATAINQSARIDPTPILTYNRQRLVSQGFDGFHLYLEFPEALTEKPELLKKKLNQLLTQCAKLDKLLKELPHPLKLGLSIPAWYDQLDMQLLADSVYAADELIITLPEKLKVAELVKELQTELQLGRQMGRRIWLALYDNHFKQAGQPELDEYIEQVISQEQQPVGFMIFNYQTYQSLEEM